MAYQPLEFHLQQQAAFSPCNQTLFETQYRTTLDHPSFTNLIKPGMDKITADGYDR